MQLPEPFHGRGLRRAPDAEPHRVGGRVVFVGDRHRRGSVDLNHPDGDAGVSVETQKGRCRRRQGRGWGRGRRG